MSVWRTDAEAQLQFAIRYQDPDPTVIDEFGNPMVYESDPVYFDTNEGNPNGAIGADQWVTVEIPLADFGAIDPSTVVGVMLYTNDHEVVTDEDGNPLNADGNPVAEGEEPATQPVASREEIYVSELYFAGTPDAPRAAAEVPAHAQADVVAVYSDDYTTSDVNMAGSLTQATYALRQWAAARSRSTPTFRGSRSARTTRLSCRPRPTRHRSCILISGAHRPTRTRT